MKILVVGSGGREHALVWKFRQDDPQCEIVVAPGNAGIAQVARCVPIAATDINALLELAETEQVDFTMVGPEGALAAGIVDRFRAAGQAVFGPSRAAARIESSKRFAKELMLANRIPTAAASFHSSLDTAKQAVRDVGAPVVVKASGLASGKGVVVAQSLDEAFDALDQILGERLYDDAGNEVLIEEFMDGEEISVFAITDGENFSVLPPAQDHKRLLEGDAGPNTGGMGAYSPVSIATPSVIAEISEKIIAPTLRAMRKAGFPFTGLLYTGVMLTSAGPRVVEFNCRFGDPETQAILPLLAGPILPVIHAVARGDSIAGTSPIRSKPDRSATVVLAAEGYPGKPRTGDPITFVTPSAGMEVFHAGTAVSRDSESVVTAGGRVLAVTSVAPSLPQAIVRICELADRIQFEGKQFRRDIGHRELERIARTT